MAVVKPNLADRALAGWRDQAAPITRKSVFLRIRRQHGDPTLDGNGWTPAHQPAGLTAGAIMTHDPASQQMPTALAERAEPRTNRERGDTSRGATEPALVPGGLQEDAGTPPARSKRLPPNVVWPPRGHRLTRHDIDFGSDSSYLRHPAKAIEAKRSPEGTRRVLIPSSDDARSPRAGEERASDWPRACWAG